MAAEGGGFKNPAYDLDYDIPDDEYDNYEQGHDKTTPWSHGEEIEIQTVQYEKGGGPDESYLEPLSFDIFYSSRWQTNAA